MKEKLIELLMSAERNAEEQGFFNCHRSKGKAECIADYLLANGVILLPCKVGDTVYIKGEAAAIDSIHIDRTTTYRVRFLCYGRDCSTCPFYEKHDCKAPDKITADDIGVTVFLTKEEAEKALKERENID